MNKFRLSLTAILLMALGLLLTACAPAAAPAEVETISIALLPVLDTLPFYIAEQKGYFTEEGVNVVGLPVSGTVEADQLVQTGEADAILNSMASVALFNRESNGMKIVAIARSAETGPVFRILARPGSDIGSPADLAGVPVALAENTIVEYISQRMLEEEGLTPEEILFQGVPVLPERYQLLMSGEVQAALLPDPLAQAAIEQGAVLVIEDAQYPQYSITTLNVLNSALENKPEAVRAFVRAWFRAIDDLNANPEAYRALFLEKVNVPESVQATYVIPPFVTAGIPDEVSWDDVNAWLVGKGVLDTALPYSESVTVDFLP